MRIIYILLLFIHLSSYAQTSIGLFIEPSAQLSSLSEYDQHEYDSVKPLMRNDLGISFGLDIGINKDKFNSFHIKPGYYQYGFMLVRENLKLFDVVHASLGAILDQSQASNKMAYMHHRFKYAGLQMEYHRDISPRLKNIGVSFHVGGGLGYFYLLEHDIKIRTEGFAYKEQFKHVAKDDLYFEANKHIVSFHALFETIYSPAPSLEVFAQLLVKAPINHLTKKDASIYTWMPALNVGIRKEI